MDIKYITIKAINNNELINLLEGSAPYKVELNQWIGACVPTDVGSVLTKGIYEVYKDNPNCNIDKLLEETLIKMIDGEIFDLYCALSTFYSQLIEESFDSSPFKINKDKIIKKLRYTLKNNEDKLRNYFEWEGIGRPEGMWTEVLRINSLCQKYGGISIL